MLLPPKLNNTREPEKIWGGREYGHTWKDRVNPLSPNGSQEFTCGSPKHQGKYTYLVMETYNLLCLGKGGMHK